MDNTSSEQSIDFSSTPQFNHLIWKGQNWYGIANYVPLCFGGFFIFAGMIVLAEKRDTHYAPTIFLVALICILMIIPLRKLGKSILSMGIDKKLNVFWVKFAEKAFYEPNAHLITEFNLQKILYTKINPAWKITGPQPLLFRNANWLLVYKRSNNDYFWQFNNVGFARKKDAMAVVRKANELLRIHLSTN